MKKVFSLLGVMWLSCSPVSNTLSLGTSKKIFVRHMTDHGIGLVQPLAPDNVLVLGRNIQTPSGAWRNVYAVYVQQRTGTAWTMVDYWPYDADSFPRILRIAQPKLDVLVVDIAMGKDRLATQSYLYKNGTWTPR